MKLSKSFLACVALALISVTVAQDDATTAGKEEYWVN